MARILITSGPTREYLDPIRFISNESSGRMGQAMAAAALEQGHEVTVVSGPVAITYPLAATVVDVITTADLEREVQALYPSFDGIIAAAAPCDFRPRHPADRKIKKTGSGIAIEFKETDDVLKKVSCNKGANQWSVGFALETDNGIPNAQKKLREKNLDLIVLNGPEAMNSGSNSIRILSSERVEAEYSGSKPEVARHLLGLITRNLVG